MGGALDEGLQGCGGMNGDLSDRNRRRSFSIIGCNALEGGGV
jgi:hypothetical protein